jgi:hypothetical protein
MKYSEFPYKRLTVDSQNALMVDWLVRFKDAESAADQITVLEEVDENELDFIEELEIQVFENHNSRNFQLPDCVTVTVVMQQNFKEITLDFGDGCEVNGKFLAGIMIITFEPNPDAAQREITTFFDNWPEALHHQKGGFGAGMLVSQIDRNFCNIFCTLHPCTFDQAGIIERDTHPFKKFEIEYLFFLLEDIDDTFAHLFGLIDGTACGCIDIDREGIVTLSGKHPCQDQLCRQHQDRSKECYSCQYNHQSFFKFTFENSVNKIFKFFHDFSPLFSGERLRFFL